MGDGRCLQEAQTVQLLRFSDQKRCIRCILQCSKSELFFLSAVKLTSASTTKGESKRQEIKETVEGMKGRKANSGWTFGLMFSALIQPCICITMLSSGPVTRIVIFCTLLVFE